MSHRKTRLPRHSLPKHALLSSTAPRYPARLWGGLLLLGTVVVVALFAWQVKNLNTNTSTSTSSQPVNGPRLVFEETTFDVGKVPLDRTIERTYVYRNVGSETVVLTEQPTVDVIEGC